MSLFTALPFLLLSVVTASCADKETENCEYIQKTCPMIACDPPGINGIPGKDGRDGAKGEKGEPGTVWAVLSLQLFISQRKLPGLGGGQCIHASCITLNYIFSFETEIQL